MKILTMLNTKFELIKSTFNQINFKELSNQAIAIFKNNFQDIISKSKNIAQTNFDLGMYHYLLGNRSDAILRFNIAKFINPNYVASDYYIGRCYLESFKHQKARVYFEKYLNSKHQDFIEETQYCINLLNNKGAEISSIPKSIIKATFDIIAQALDNNKIIIQQQDIIPQQSLFAGTIQLLMAKNKPFGNDILDIGSGTGIMGKFCRVQKIANIIMGVDISSLMAGRSSYLMLDDMKVYNNVKVIDYELYLKDPNTLNFNFDVIFASDLITYNSNLDFFFQNIYPIIKENGLLGITFKTTSNKDVEFKPLFEQFYFSSEYVKTIADKYSWKLVKEENTTFSNNEQGKVIIFSK
ncbi:hypothetical protein NF27_HJ00250 [Candidatus Jidaibacter acanthamoeba]|uniref:Methyltransferase type 12 domain-containing protein n=1 Tax=Candidatus Jidaibacter acanthamoebae TaxID=86105 RepID=A0A0C1MRB4_9RICK|nr:methyltransferase [Candidatus Jidaibacter acanthamoeba]KIE04572.1 hypothetical protein NF27_HJ00250 [Candidatus Jidaibacter acanthamoeba]